MGWETAPAQGIIAIQSARQETIWAQINDADSFGDLMLERALVRGLGAHCRLPVSCLTKSDDARAYMKIQLSAWAADGTRKVLEQKLDLAQPLADLVAEAEGLGKTLKAKLPPGYWG